MVAGLSAGCSASAWGRLICSSAICENVVVTIKKISITRRTSIIGIRLISGSSRCFPRRKFMGLLALAVNDFHQLDRLLLHFHHQGFSLGAEEAVEDHAGYGHDQPHGGVIERDRDAVREHGRTAAGRR